MNEKINYSHNNPVKEGLVFNPKEYVLVVKDYSVIIVVLKGITIVN